MWHTLNGDGDSSMWSSYYCFQVFWKWCVYTLYMVQNHATCSRMNEYREDENVRKYQSACAWACVPSFKYIVYCYTIMCIVQL